jgi:hypothetical protein
MTRQNGNVPAFLFAYGSMLDRIRFSPDDNSGGGDDESVDSLKKRLSDVNAESAARRREIADLKKQIESLKQTSANPEELEALRNQAKEAEARRQREQSEITVLNEQLNKLRQTTEKTVAEAKAEAEAAKRSRNELLIHSFVRNAWEQITAFPVSDFLSSIAASLDVDDKGKIVVRPNPDGSAPQDPDRPTADLTAQRLVETFIASRPYLQTVKPSQGSGSGSARDASKMKAEELDRLDDKQFGAALGIKHRAFNK